MGGSFDFDVDFGTPTVFQTLSLAYGNGNIVNAKVLLTGSYVDSIDTFAIYLSNDGGNSWELATHNVTHTFSSTGNDLRLKIEGASGNVLTVTHGDGSDTPLIIMYNV